MFLSSNKLVPICLEACFFETSIIIVTFCSTIVKMLFDVFNILGPAVGYHWHTHKGKLHVGIHVKGIVECREHKIVTLFGVVGRMLIYGVESNKPTRYKRNSCTTAGSVNFLEEEAPTLTKMVAQSAL